ncbi:MAG: hypothetical protein R3B57_02390 [Phycisphaerales bacterium]
MPNPAVEQEAPPPTYRTWLLRVRPAGFEHEPWSDLRVAARSAIQAEAILRRQGYDVSPEGARTVAGSPDPFTPAVPPPLRCGKCGYELDGLVVHQAIIQCPECAFAQVVTCWGPAAVSEPSMPRVVVYLFAIIGGIVVALFSLVMIAGLLF